MVAAAVLLDVQSLPVHGVMSVSYTHLDVYKRQLFTIPAWEDVLSEEKRLEIVKAYKRSKTVHVEKKPGRNDPCPCGSGKKYKKCCGRA